MTHCPDCGEPLPPDAPGGNCPTCLLNLALPPAEPTSAPAPAGPATRRFGDFELLEEIGAGGMGTVYRARQISLNRIVALKLIRTGQLASEQEVRRFKLEAEATAGLDHPHIVPVYEVGEHVGWHYFAMRFVEGQSLANRIASSQPGRSRREEAQTSDETAPVQAPRSRGRESAPSAKDRDQRRLTSAATRDFGSTPPLTQREAAALLAKTARAVHYAHQHGILHRDLKPSNLLLDTAGEPQVTDFGLAKHLDASQPSALNPHLTLTGQMLGTPAYMAPEQAQGGAKRLTTAADVYSLGVILYELLTGRPPFLADTPLATLRAVVEQEPVPPSKVPRTEPRTPGQSLPDRSAAQGRVNRKSKIVNPIDRDLETICLRCLEKNPDRRYRSAEALAEELDRWLRHEPIHARPSSVWMRTGKWARRRPAVAAAITLLVLGTTISTWQAIRATRAQRQAESAATQARMIVDFLDRLSASVAPDRSPTTLSETIAQTASQLLAGMSNQPQFEAQFRGLVGKFHLTLGDLSKAEEMAREAMAMERRLAENPSHDVATAARNLAIVLQRVSKLPEAESLARESVAIRRRLLGDQHPEVGESLHTLGQVLLHAGKPQEAESVTREALAIKRQRVAAEDGTTANLLANLAVMLEKGGKLDEAETLHHEALAMKRKLLGNENADVALSLNNLAVVFEKQGKLAEAETLHREALALRRKLLGDEAPEIATSLNNLAVVLGKQGKLAETEHALREALAIQRKVLRSDHPDLAAYLYNLAYIMAKQGKLDEAVPLFRESLAMRRKLLGDTHPDVAVFLHTMARLLAGQGRLREAEEFCADGLDHTAPQGMTLAGLLELRGHLRARRGLWAAAFADFAESSRLNPEDQATWYYRATLLVQTGDQPGYSRCCQTMLERDGSSTNLAIAMRTAKACLLLPAAAGVDLAAVARLAEFCVTAGKESVNLATFQALQGLADYRQGKFDQAVEWSTKALAQAGTNHLRDAQARAVLAMAQQASGQTEPARAALSQATELADARLPELGSDELGPDWHNWIVARALLAEAATRVAAPPIQADTPQRRPGGNN